MNKFITTLIVSLLSALPHTIYAASLECYAGVDSMRSSKYSITISQGKTTKQSFVYEDHNKFRSNELHRNESNHWTNFAFSGGKVTVEITLSNGAHGEYELRPAAHGINFKQDGNRITFSLSKPTKLYLWSKESDRDPLFIFANRVEPKPNLDDPNLVYWGAGVHNIGKHYPLKSGKTYYLAGGAYLKGSLLSEEDAHDITVCGQGILSGEEIEHGSYKKTRFDRMALRLLGEGATNFRVEGITIINPGQYCIQAYGGELHTRNVKCFGWWYETDGWVGGDNSTLSDSFFKVYDDIVKIYFDNLRVENLTIYKQNNGAVFQYGWSGESSDGANVRDIFVVQDDTKWNQSEMKGNRGFLNTATGDERNRVSNFNIENIHYDGDISYLLGIRSLGNYSNITISDMYVRGVQRFKSYLSGGTISGITLKNVTIGGKKVLCDDDIKLQTGGSVVPILYK